MTALGQSGNSRIAKNVFFMYIRMALSMAVGLYSSRVVLQVLGVDDYGLWNVVAGLVVIFQFLNSAMSGCSSRFIAYELGKGLSGSPQKVFSAALTIHIFIAFIVFVLCQTVGLWFLRCKLSVPTERVEAAFIIFQFSVVSSMFSITQVPYNASILANERMDVYAYIELLNVGLRLGILYLLMILPGDNLIVYGVLVTSVSIFIALLYRLYCVRHLDYCKFRLILDFGTLKPMLSFSLWDLYGNGAVMIRTQGVNMLLNIFFSVTVNAACAVATSVQNAVMSLASSVLAAFRPQIVKNYAGGNYARVGELINKASTYTTILLYIFIIPLLLEMDFVLRIWLKKPPEYASIFCRLVLLFIVVANLSTIVVSGIHATGKIKRTSFINGSLYMLVIPFSYVSFLLNQEPFIAYLFNIVAVVLGLLQNVSVLHKYIPQFRVSIFCFRVILFCLVGIGLYAILSFCRGCMEPSFVRFCTLSLVNFVLLVIISFCGVLDEEDKTVVIERLKRVKKWLSRSK